MLTMFGADRRFCDGVSRRSFLKIGGLAMGGLGLPDLLRAEARPGSSGSHKSVIMVYLSGGLSHHDTFDLKPDAPAEVRGEFKPIATDVPGIQVGELLPEIAKVDRQAGDHPLDRRAARRAFELAEPDRLPDDAGQARRPAALRLGDLPGPGAGRPGRPAVRRPVPDHAAQAVQQRRGRVPRADLPGVEARRGRGPGADQADRRRRRPVRRPQAGSSASSTGCAGPSTTPRSRGWTPTTGPPSRS